MNVLRGKRAPDRQEEKACVTVGRSEISGKKEVRCLLRKRSGKVPDHPVCTERRAFAVYSSEGMLWMKLVQRKPEFLLTWAKNVVFQGQRQGVFLWFQ